jgi:HD-like signal output (HDOD) protein
MGSTQAAITEADLVRVAEKLPAAPRLLVELGQAMQDPDVEADEVVALLRQDQSLVAQIIRMANSAAYAPASPVGSLERALAAVGFAEVHRLVGVVASRQLSELTTRWYPISAAKIRQNALYVAVIMEELAKPARESPRQCYTAGLLRTIGMLALDRLSQPNDQVVPFGESGEQDLPAWERQTWGMSNVEAAEIILRQWKLPHETVTAVRHHYQPAGRHNPIAHLLLLAASSAHDRYFGIPGEEAYLVPAPENFTKSGVKPLHFQQACEEAQRNFDRLLMAAG